MTKQHILICDFDGTLIHQNLETRFLKYLVKNKKLCWFDWILILCCTPVNILCNKLQRPSIVKVWTAWRTPSAIQTLIDDYLSQENAITFNQSILDFVQTFAGEKHLLTGCYEPLARAFLVQQDKSDLFNHISGARAGWQNFILIQHPYGHAKKSYTRAQQHGSQYITGIGNEAADLHFLRLCDTAHVTNPEPRLKQVATASGWQIL